jgi:hypothetical protein
VITCETACRTLLEVLSLEGETSDIVVNAIVNSVKNLNIEDEIISLR